MKLMKNMRKETFSIHLMPSLPVFMSQNFSQTQWENLRIR
jgi:hypothetical protein